METTLVRRCFIFGIFLVATCWLTSSNALAQNGDKAGEIQHPLSSNLVIPMAPPLDVVAALKSFKLQPEFDIQIVASEPLV
ncbi:MAG: hypothetical protein NTV12_09080, partial [Verrucomicrobia bacterium]|nr:hypothetical protein [Verrucomicrobiota bacterium]